jgi:hypothetical protein
VGQKSLTKPSGRRRKRMSLGKIPPSRGPWGGTFHGGLRLYRALHYLPPLCRWSRRFRSQLTTGLQSHRLGLDFLRRWSVSQSLLLKGRFITWFIISIRLVCQDQQREYFYMRVFRDLLGIVHLFLKMKMKMETKIKVKVKGKGRNRNRMKMVKKKVVKKN